MKLARFWARGSEEFAGYRAVARGWSDESVDDARRVARETASRVAQKLASGTAKGHYLYGDRPLPEPIIRTFVDDAGATRAAVTRNAHGALVLNTSDLMFVDIDREEPGSDSKIPPSIVAVAQRSNLAARVYKTAAGYRVLVTNARYTAGDARSQELLQQFGSDPLYVRLCSMQQSFRARLTPKPWRCDLGMPPVTFPFETPQAEALYAEWVRKYTTATRLYATCKYLGFTGSAMEPGFEELVLLHDQETKATSSMPLASPANPGHCHRCRVS